MSFLDRFFLFWRTLRTLRLKNRKSVTLSLSASLKTGFVEGRKL
jgi:hypothetical protein